MTVIPIRADNAYYGVSQQSVQGTPVAPTKFYRWMDGSNIQIDLKTEEVWEGDGSRRLSQLIKNQQVTKFKIVHTPRPVNLGFSEKAAQGIASDAITPVAPTTTSTTSATAGTTTTMTLTSGTGFAAASQSGTFQMLVGTGASNDPYETVTFNAPTSGAVLTVAAGYNGGKFAQNHITGTTVTNIAAINTSLTSGASANATTIVVGNQIGFSGTPVVMLSPGLTSEEIVTINASSVTGTGPWTYTLANSATLKNAHSSGDAVIGAVSHVLTDQSDGNYYTWEISLGGTSGVILRITDCKLDQIKVSGKAGSLLMYEEDWVGLISVSQASASTVTLEAHNPFLYTQGAWTLNSLTTGDALTFELFDITRKNNLDTTIQTEQLILAATIFGNLNVDAAADIVYQNAQLIKLVYFGGTSGTTDAQAMGAGALSVTFTQADSFHAVTYALTTLHYSKVGFPTPKKDGKHFKQSISTSSVSNQGANAYILQTTVQNGQTGIY